MSRRRAAVLASLGLVLAGCGGGPAAGPVVRAGSTASTAASAAVPTSAAPASTIGSGSTGTGSVGPGSTVSAAPQPGTTTVVAPGGPTTSAPGTTSAPTTTATPPAPAGSGAYGYVTAGPTCPVERAGQPCPPDPVVATIEARTASGSIAGTTHSDSAGQYRLALPPGGYTLSASTGGTFPRCQPAQVVVRPGGPTRADISCDTGIR